MTRGRKPLPESVKRLAGNPGKRKIRPDLPAPKGVPEMPKRLMVEPAAVEKWQEMVPILTELGTLTLSDGEALATLCEVYAATQTCLLELRARGPVMQTDSGGVKPNPAGPLYRGLVALQASLMSEFGLTPSSRVRLGGKAEAPQDELEAFFAADRAG